MTPSSYMQVLNIEFILLWCTYLAIMFTNLEAGILIGIILATMYFAFSYARVCFAALLTRCQMSGLAGSIGSTGGV